MNSLEDIHLIRPAEDFSPQIGTFINMLNRVRVSLFWQVEHLSIEYLDYLQDAHANRIGAMLLHIAATERFYQIHTFEGKNWGDWDIEDKNRWSLAFELGEKARNEIVGHDIDFYIDQLEEVRNVTLNKFLEYDDDWLFNKDENWPWGPTNNFCKWMHIYDHDAVHMGQIRWLKKRLPSNNAEVSIND